MSVREQTLEGESIFTIKWKTDDINRQYRNAGNVMQGMRELEVST